MENEYLSRITSPNFIYWASIVVFNLVIIGGVIGIVVLLKDVKKSEDQTKDKSDEDLINSIIRIGSIVSILSIVVGVIAFKFYDASNILPRLVYYFSMAVMFVIGVLWIYIALITKDVEIFFGINSSTFLFLLGSFLIVVAFSMVVYMMRFHEGVLRRVEEELRRRPPESDILEQEEEEYNY